MIEVDLGQVVAAVPQAPVDGVLHPGAVGPGLGTEHPPASLARGLLGVHALRLQRGTLATHAGGQGVEILGFIKCGYRLHCGIEQADEVAEGITEKAGNAQGHVHPRAVEQAERQDLEIVDPLATSGPHRSHAHQRHGLGDIITAGTHGCRAPH